MKKILLGSSSPRRKEILGIFKLPITQIPSTFDEDAVPFTGSPVDYVIKIAQGKIETLVPHYQEEIIITADTTVYQSGKIFGKPLTQEEAFNTLSTLQDTWHSVYTGISIASPWGMESSFEETKVLFNPLTEQQIKHYLTHVDWKDKAGGYAIQGSGSLLIRRIEGCFFNVMGLPINALAKLLKNHGIDLWDTLGK